MIFLLLVAVSFLIFQAPLRALVHYTLAGGHDYDKYSYTLGIPCLSLALVLFEKRRIFAGIRWSTGTGIAVGIAALLLNGISTRALTRLGQDDALSARVLALVAFWLGAFIFCYGIRAFRAGAFPLLFLLLTVPVPDSVLSKPITVVQYGSTEVCSVLFSLSGVPFIRDGLRFTLSNVTIEVARQCSGIHSTFAIVISSLIAGYLFLASAWRRMALVVFALPVVCVSNGLRIAGLTLLAEYVDPDFLLGNLHRSGGVFFFLLALLMLFGILSLLRRGQATLAAEFPGPKLLAP